MEKTELIENRTDEMFDLGKYAFRSADTAEIRERFAVLTEHSWNYGHLVNDVLASQLQATPFTVFIGESEVKMAGIGTVSSYPEFRGQGGVNQLMGKMLADINQAGVDLSYLAPFSYPFYRRYGYEYLFEKTVYRMKAADWPLMTKPAGSLQRFSYQEAKHFLREIYHQSMSGKTGPVNREDWWYDYKFLMKKDYQYAVYFDEENLPQGYLVYYFEEEQFTIYEWEYLTQAAFVSLANYCGSHKDSFEVFHYETGKNAVNLNYLFASPLLEVTVKPEMMGRIVNVSRFLDNYPFKTTGKALQFRLHITEDKYGPWNSGDYQINISELGKCQLIKDTIQPELSTLSCDIQGLTQLLLGFTTPQELAFYQKISGPAELLEDLSLCLLNQKPILEDYF